MKSAPLDNVMNESRNGLNLNTVLIAFQLFVLVAGGLFFVTDIKADVRVVSTQVTGLERLMQTQITDISNRVQRLETPPR